MNNDNRTKTRAQILGENLVRIRKQRGYSREKLGELVGVSEKTIGAYEIGTNAPKLDTIFALADALKVPINEITGDAKKSQQQNFFESVIEATGGEIIPHDNRVRFIVKGFDDLIAAAYYDFSKEEFVHEITQILMSAIKKDVSFLTAFKEYFENSLKYKQKP